MNKYCGYQPATAASVTNDISNHHAAFLSNDCIMHLACAKSTVQ